MSTILEDGRHGAHGGDRALKTYDNIKTRSDKEKERDSRGIIRRFFDRLN